MHKRSHGLRQKLEGKSLRLIFTVVFLLTVCVLTATIIALFSAYAKNQIGGFLKEKNMQQLRTMSYGMEETVNDTIELANTVYYQILKNADLQDADTQQELQDFCRLHADQLLDAAVYAMDGTLLWQNTSGFVAAGSMEETWFQQAAKDIDTVVFGEPSYVQTEDGFEKGMPISRYVELNNHGIAQSGVLRFDIRMEDLATELSIYPSSYQDYLYLMNRDGAILYHPFEKELESGIRTEWTAAVDTESVVSHEQTDWMIQQQPIGYTGWKLVSVASLTAEIQSSNYIRTGILLILILMAMVSLFLDFVIQRLMIHPVMRLSKTMQQFGAGKMEVRASEHGCGEIKGLAVGFNDMAENTNQLMNRLLQEEKEKRITERKLLQSQINPHFLYNTLDSIIWMIQSKRYEGAGKMVSLLAKFFRISLSQGNDIIPLQKELEHAVSYLSIQNIRFGDKFMFHVEFDETLGDCLCPKLIIQPLLENAVYHGMEGMYEDGEIVIKIYAVDDLVRIDVIDNGEGMTEEQVAKMMQGNVVSSKRGSGIGVKNVNDRVRLYFGDTYGVTILSALDEGTTARITFPARRQLDETAS